MASTIVFNGTSYSIPAEGDSGWGTDVSNYLIAISTNVLQRSGGSFVLTSELDFGNSFGVKLPYLKSVATNPSGTGIIRLGNNESIGWRNAANNADLLLTVNASNVLQFNSQSFIFSGLGSILNADVSASAAIVYSKLSLTNSIVNADISASAAIGYSKLNLSSSILNSDISLGAAIALSKLAPLGTGKALQSNASTGVIEVSSVTNAELGYLSGVTSSIQTQLGTKVTNPMTTGGDIIYGGVSGVPTRLANGTNGQFLKSNGTTAAPSWSNPTIALTAPTVQKFLSGSGTYTTPANVLYIKVTMIGGGGGGGGGGTSGGNGGAGGATTFGTSLLSAGAGTGGAASGGSPGVGGASSLGTGPIGIALAGAGGGGASGASSSGGIGGNSAFGGGGGNGGGGFSAGFAAATNSGSGGGGGGCTSTASGAGGGSGGFASAIIISPSASYSYSVGAAGTAGTAGSGGGAGGAGGAGVIIVEEHYQ